MGNRKATTAANADLDYEGITGKLKEMWTALSAEEKAAWEQKAADRYAKELAAAGAGTFVLVYLSRVYALLLFLPVAGFGWCCYVCAVFRSF
jgi:hypothetical protein